MTDGGCAECPVNTYSGEGADSCTECPEGTTSPAASTSEDACEPGYKFSFNYVCFDDLLHLRS